MKLKLLIMRPVLHNKIQVGVTSQRKIPKGNINCILSGVSYNTDHVPFQVCFYLTSSGSLLERLLGWGQGADVSERLPRELAFIGDE